MKRLTNGILTSGILTTGVCGILVGGAMGYAIGKREDICQKYGRDRIYIAINPDNYKDASNADVSFGLELVKNRQDFWNKNFPNTCYVPLDFLSSNMFSSRFKKIILKNEK